MLWGGSPVYPELLSHLWRGCFEASMSGSSSQPSLNTQLLLMLSFFYYKSLFIYLFIYLLLLLFWAVLRSLRDLSSPTRDQTRALVES